VEKLLVCGGGGFIGGHRRGGSLEAGASRHPSVDIKPFDEWYQKFPEVENVQLDLQTRTRARRRVRARAKSITSRRTWAAWGSSKQPLPLHVVGAHQHALVMAAKKFGVKNFSTRRRPASYNADKQRNENVTALKEEDAYPAMPEDGYAGKNFLASACAGITARTRRAGRAWRGFTTSMARTGTGDGGREKAPAAVCRKVDHGQALRQT